jgi:hypothetical protein
MIRISKTIMERETEGRRRKDRALGTRIDGVRYDMDKCGLRAEDATQKRVEKKDFPVEIPVCFV